jgi:RNA polymerase sigma-70 factor, ECF subfamily
VESSLAIEEGDGEIRKSTDTPGSSRPMRYSCLSLKDLVCLLCADSCDDEVWEEFVSRVGRPISLTIIRTTRSASRRDKPSQSLVEDLRQETYVKLLQGGCRLLRDRAIQHPETLLGYLKVIAANVVRDHFKRVRSPKWGGDSPHVSVSDVDPEAGKQVDGSQERIAFGVLEKEIDELLKYFSTGPDQERDRTIFWLYFRQGMSTKKISSLPSIVGLTAKGVGSVIERLKHGIREQIVGSRLDSDDDQE